MSETLPEPILAPPPPSDELQVVDYQSTPKDTLVVAWIAGHFEAAAFRKGHVVSTRFTRAGCGSSDAFEAALDAALAHFSFKGRNVELLIDGGLLDTAIITLPPASSRQQAAFIREKTRRMQAESSALVWESQRIAASKSGQRAFVHSLSKEAFNVLEEQFAERELQLKKALPFMGVAAKPFKDVQTPAESASVVLVPVGGGYKILAIDHAGDLQFARDLNKENGTDPQRVAVEINRCILFARQQFGKPVSQIVTVGLQAARFKAGIKNLLQGEIPIIHRSAKPQLWLNQLGASHAFNLAKESMLQDRKLRLRKILVSAALLLAGAGLVSYAYRTERSFQTARDHLAYLANNEAEMRATIDDAEARNARAASLSQFVAATDSLVRPPVEQALVNVLAAALPSDTWVSQLETTWDPKSELWQVHLLLLCDADSSVAERRKENLRKALQASPLAMQFPESPLDRIRSITTRGSSQSAEPIALDGTISRRRSDER